jgi:hypothetical protein
MVNPGDYIHIRMVSHPSFNHFEICQLNNSLLYKLEDMLLFDLEDKLVKLYE